MKAQRKRKKRSYGWNNHNNNDDVFGSEKSSCRARFQQSPVEVYAKFLAMDQVINYFEYKLNAPFFICENYNNVLLS